MQVVRALRRIRRTATPVLKDNLDKPHAAVNEPVNVQEPIAAQAAVCPTEPQAGVYIVHLDHCQPRL